MPPFAFFPAGRHLILSCLVSMRKFGIGVRFQKAKTCPGRPTSYRGLSIDGSGGLNLISKTTARNLCLRTMSDEDYLAMFHCHGQRILLSSSAVT